MSHSIRRSPPPARALLGAIVLLAGLAACTNGQFRGGPIFDYGLSVAGLGKDDATAAEPAQSVGPPVIVGFNTIRVALPGVGKRGQSDYYVAPDGVELAMNNGFVTRAIGLGVELEGMYLPAESPYMNGFVQSARAGATSKRVADYYRNRRIVHDSFTCTLAYESGEGSRGVITETCQRPYADGGFVNAYWTEGERVICSRQWFHPDSQPLQFFETAEQAKTLDLVKGGC